MLYYLSCRSFFAALSVFSLTGIPVWVGIQLIVGYCVDLDLCTIFVFFSASSFFWQRPQAVACPFQQLAHFKSVLLVVLALVY